LRTPEDGEFERRSATVTISSIPLRRVTWLSTVPFAVVLVVMAGCASTGSEPSADPSEEATGASTTGATPGPSTEGTIIVSDSGCAVEGIPSPLQAGSVALTIVNTTDGDVVGNMSRILEGGTFEQLTAHVRREIRRAEAGEPALGHPSYAPPSFDLFVDPGDSEVLMGEVTAGTYAIVCGRVYDEVGELRPSAVLGPYEVD
jgi:hypothetical protein